MRTAKSYSSFINDLLLMKIELSELPLEGLDPVYMNAAQTHLSSAVELLTDLERKKE